jgi:DNA processing protein
MSIDRHDTPVSSAPFSATPNDATYPARLRALASPPAWLEAEGPLASRLGALPPAVALVGTRDAPLEALELSRRLARSLAAAGVVVVSGGAIGIDHAAHEGALEAGGVTVVVLPAGLDAWSPPRHAPLFARARERGALVAIRPRGSHVRREWFLERNQVIAALADEVVVVASPLQGGARSTAAAARQLGRRLWAVPGAPWDPRMAGCALELAMGARALDAPGRLLAALGLPMEAGRDLALEPTPPPPPPPPRSSARLSSARGRNRAASKASPPSNAGSTVAPPSSAITRIEPANPAEKALLAALATGPASVDELVLRTALGVGELRALLLTWTVEGVVREGPAGLFLLLTV